MWNYNVEKTFLERLKHNEDLLLSIKEVFKSSGIKMATFMAIGAVKRARIAFYNQKELVYEELSLDEPAEILSCFGNVSEVDGDTSIHAHITLGFKDGVVKGGHLLKGTTIFACELFGVVLEGEELKRHYDSVTGLSLWEF